MKVDFHSHFLPGIDDGAKTPGQSVEILSYLAAHGIETVAATPHFARHGESVASFLERRADAVRRLDDYIEESGVDRRSLPDIVLGAEVHLYEDLTEREGLDKLCYEGTDHILLELPFRKFEGWELEEVYNIMYQFKVKPVMAHINRYVDYYSKSEFSDMFYNGDFTLQLNAEASPSLFKKVMKSGYPFVVGCDIHNPDSAASYGLEKAKKLLDRRGFSVEFERYERSVIGR